MNQGISIIIHANKNDKELDSFLSSFFAVNTYTPVEVIVVGESSLESTIKIVSQHSAKGVIRYIILNNNLDHDNISLNSQPLCWNHGAGRAK